MASIATIEIAREVRHHLAGRALTEAQAKLYSQHLRYDMGQRGLASFAASDVYTYLDEAMLLLQCGLLERVANPTSAWRDGIKRAAEILEWLSQPNLKPTEAPLHLLAAAAYQLADYPAMALGHLRRVPDDQPFSVILREFLRANFPATIDAIRNYWMCGSVRDITDPTDLCEITTYTFKHVVMCIGTVCNYLRMGVNEEIERALEKLDKLARSLLHSRDLYSYMLALLTAASCRRFVETSLWPQIDRLRGVSTNAAGEALNQFARSAFINRRALVWPAQATGIERLRENSSFVLCTPTGSGKTTVATLAAVQCIFVDPPVDPFDFAAHSPGNLVLYLVPSRALAAEVEIRLSQDLQRITPEPVIVTGLYGGIDWGPTDAWIQADRVTIVICTFEKADALLRYLSIQFLSRVRLVVVDEAHMVEQDRANLVGLEDGSSRALKLEQLGTRLLRAQNKYGFRVLALSAVAALEAPALARWIGGTPDAVQTTSSYRSTRQMLGRLEVHATGRYTIHYDLMDGRSLKFNEEGRAYGPFVPDPFSAFPGSISNEEGPEVRMRGPALWAALQLAAELPDGSTPSVLISLTQNIEAFSATCADLLDNWSEDILPNYWAVNEGDDLWSRCLASAEDYFSAESVEYRLLRRGIAVHHGKMPGLLARRLKAVIDRGYVRVIIATSTLSEGVNLPINYLVIPSLFRGPSVLSPQEFANLVGRVGRPGVATEGSVLVVLPERTYSRDRYGRKRLIPSRQWNGYLELVTKIEQMTATGVGILEEKTSSPLAHLITALENSWNELTGGGTTEEFMTWLEQTAVVGTNEEAGTAFQYLDQLDAFLIAAIQEVEELHIVELSPEQIEVELIAIWRRTYAFAAAQEETRLARIWLARGRSIKARYPGSDQRRQIYKTSLSPRSATSLINITEAVRAVLQTGAGYARWSPEQRFTFIHDVIALLTQVPSFRITTKLGRRNDFADWPKLLRWWLSKTTLPVQPLPREITGWFDFVAKNFIYRGAWGMGSIIGLLLDAAEGEQRIRALEIGDWPRSGLPWIAFWIKELINWGTLDPVAAYLLARGDAINRPKAEEEACAYYAGLPHDIDDNDVLDPRAVRAWADARSKNLEVSRSVHEFRIVVTLMRPPTDYLKPCLSVLPIEIEDGLIWIDPAGYSVARSEKPSDWTDIPSMYEFELSIIDKLVIGKAYLKYE